MRTMSVLIAGGAGYIGSTIASACSDAGISPVILDSLVTGRREFAAGAAFYQGDIADGPLVDRIFAEHPGISVVIHAAALIVVPDSVANPVGYYEANVAKSLQFATHLLRNDCRRLIFSSSAAIYRADADLTVDEDSAIDPQESVRADQGGMRGDVRRHRRLPAYPRAVLAILQPGRHGPQDADRAAPSPADERPGQDDPGTRARRPVPDLRDGLADPGRYRHPGLRPRLGSGRCARRRAGPVRRTAWASNGHQPGQRRGHHGPGAARRVQPGGRSPRRDA